MPYKDPEKRREYYRKYRKTSAVYRAVKRRYESSAKGRQAHRRYLASDKGKDTQRAYRRHQQGRIRARSRLNHAIRDGRLKRQPCEVCGKRKTEGHHDDYRKPLDVRWLCHECHLNLHNRTVYAS